MKRAGRGLTGALALLALLAAGRASADQAAGEPAAPASPGAERVVAEVTALLAAQAEAWSRGDLEAFCAVYAADALFVAPSGLTRGRAELLARYQRRYPDAAAMGRLTLDVLDVRPGDDQAGVAARWTLHREGQEELTGLTLLVFARQDGGGWRIVQDASF